MNKKGGFTSYDGFKLIIALILLFAILALWMTSSNRSGDSLPVVEVPDIEVAPEEKPETAQEEPAIEEEATPVAEKESEAEFPPLPEPSEGLSYDAESGFILNADGEALYALNEDGTGWVPVIPDNMKKLDLSSDGYDGWTLNDEDGAKYIWDRDTHSWLEVPQEDVAEEDLTEIPECAGAASPQLSVGDDAEVVSDVNFRSSPGIGDNWITTLRAGSQLKILGEPTCLPYGNGAYLWWQLERENGAIGWTAESPISGTNYFIAPVE